MISCRMTTQRQSWEETSWWLLSSMGESQLKDRVLNIYNWFQVPLGLLWKVPRENWAGADRVPEVHGRRCSLGVSWIRFPCRVLSCLADHTDRCLFRNEKKNFGEKICSLCIYVECAGLYPESHGIVGNQFYDREVSFSSNFLQNILNVSLSAPASYPCYHYPHFHPQYLDLQISSSSLSAPASYPCYLYLDLQSILIVSANNLILPWNPTDYL